MKPKVLCFVVATGTMFSLGTGLSLAAPACKGPNKNDADCSGGGEAAAAAASTVVNSATVDWANEKIIVRGVDLDTVSAFSLGGSGPLTPGAASPTEVEFPFDGTIAAAVTAGGSYSLQLDGADGISIYFIASVVDPGLAGCPCATEWAAELGGLWGADQTACYELSGTGVEDLAGTILTDPADPSLYPQYPIGAAYYAGDPVSSVCRLVQITDTDPFTQDLVNIRINANQQSDCAALLQTNVCATTEPAVVP